MNMAHTFGMQIEVALIRTLISQRLDCVDIRSSILCMHVFTYLVTHSEAQQTTRMHATN